MLNCPAAVPTGSASLCCKTLLQGTQAYRETPSLWTPKWTLSCDLGVVKTTRDPVQQRDAKESPFRNMDFQYAWVPCNGCERTDPTARAGTTTRPDLSNCRSPFASWRISDPFSMVFRALRAFKTNVHDFRLTKGTLNKSFLFERQK